MRGRTPHFQSLDYRPRRRAPPRNVWRRVALLLQSREALTGIGGQGCCPRPSSGNGRSDISSFATNLLIAGRRRERDDRGMDDAEIERILRASRTPLGFSASGVATRMRRGVGEGRSAAAGERRSRGRPAGLGEGGRVTRVQDLGWIPEAEARRLRKAIRTSFCNSPHKKKYWTALLDMYAGPDAGKGPRRHSGIRQ